MSAGPPRPAPPAPPGAASPPGRGSGTTEEAGTAPPAPRSTPPGPAAGRPTPAAAGQSAGAGDAAKAGSVAAGTAAEWPSGRGRPTAGAATVGARAAERSGDPAAAPVPSFAPETAVGPALRAAVARLAAAGVADPAGDARRLLEHALGLAPGRLIGREATPLGAAAAGLGASLAARAARQPLAQVIGRRAFWRHDFVVTPAVLDPRPETETLVAAALERPFARVLDLGTGSGCILLSLLAERREASGLGVDLSAPALAVAEHNAARLGLPDRVRWQRGDWLEGVTGRFDLVVSNPPYVAAEEMAGLAPEVRDWEPPLALSPGGDGLGAYRAIAAAVGRVLAPGGRLLLEVGPTQADAVAALLRAVGLRVAPPRRDLDGRARVLDAAAP